MCRSSSKCNTLHPCLPKNTSGTIVSSKDVSNLMSCKSANYINAKTRFRSCLSLIKNIPCPFVCSEIWPDQRIIYRLAQNYLLFTMMWNRHGFIYSAQIGYNLLDMKASGPLCTSKEGKHEMLHTTRPHVNWLPIRVFTQHFWWQITRSSSKS